MNHRASIFRNLLSTLLIIPSLALANAAPQGSQRTQSSESETAARMPIDAPLDRSIREAGALMNEQGPALMADLDWFKSTGYLCRRTKTDIVREIGKARRSLAELETMRRSGNLEPIQARRIAYTLGMEADALAKQAVRLDEAVALVEKDGDLNRADLAHAALKRQRAVHTLSTLSRVLHGLANAIVASLKQR